ncbi:hypothetical protein [Providencia sp. PROV032]|uniref:hypothetical protein n=1 Tax=Providencia sp. PROV032 TaxID=2949764 RepID=UPI002349D494|nr:hypothetical protein [Providencia sp. PROV032]
MKAILWILALVLASLFFIRSCAPSLSPCGTGKGDLLRPTCEKIFGVKSQN